MTKLPRPYCLCGCKVRVTDRRCRYASYGCIPRSARVEGGRKGAIKGRFTRRMKRYAGYLQRIRQAGPTITAEDLFAIFAELEAKSWRNGYDTADKRWIRKRETAA